MQNFVYLIGSPRTHEAVVVDPGWEAERIFKTAQAECYTITAILLTHTHFDHIGAIKALLNKAKAKVYVHKREQEFLPGMKGELVPVEAGQRLQIGDLTLTCLHTPGHSPGSQCFLLEDKLISGDTLFIQACGRCDLPGGNAEELYHSLVTLSKLASNTVLLPGHNYAAQPTSTIGEERAQNPFLQAQSLRDFLALVEGEESVGDPIEKD